MTLAVVCLLLLLAVCSSLPVGATRPTISLDGEWDLRSSVNHGRYKVNVPAPWQLTAQGSQAFPGKATYTREITAPESWEGGRVFICLGAVDYYCEVFVNSTRVGAHEGGYTPFEFEIQDHLKFGGTNTISLEVTDPGPSAPMGDLKFAEIPHGKQSWYGNTSGPWQSIRLEARSQAYVERIAIDTDIDEPSASFTFELDGARDGVLRVSVASPEGAPEVPGVEIDVRAGAETLKWKTLMPGASLWSPDSPALYTVKTELVAGGKVVDSASCEFGLRSIEAKDGKVLLNHQPIFLAGVLDQDFYPGTEYATPSDDYVRDQFLKAKHLGLNLMRCHIKIPDPRYLRWADRLGLLVWYEIPNWITLNDNSKRRGRQTFDDMMRRDHNHPSLVIVSIINEAWGVDVNNADHRKWMAEMYDYAKAAEPSRLIVDNSACGGNFHVKTDIEDFHTYYQIPDRAPDYCHWIEDFSKHPDWTFTATPDAQRRGFEPLVLSEFGNWGLPRVSNLHKFYGEDPWWFGGRRRASSENTHPGGVEDRFAEWCLDRVFGSFDNLADAFQDQEWTALKFQIEELRKYPSIVGYVITEFTDLQWESNGLLDMCRNPKTFHDVMHTVQDQDIVFAQSKRMNYAAGDQVNFGAYVSHFSDADLAGAKLTWRVTGTRLRGEMNVTAPARGGASSVGEIGFEAPDTSVPRRLRLEVFLLNAEGAEVASNYQEFVIFPAEDPGMPSDALLATGVDAKSAARIAEGANAVICVESPDQLYLADKRIEAIDRDVDGRWGNWCSCITWLRDSPAFEGIPAVRTMDFSFENVIPQCVLTGITPDAYENDVLSGIFVGWVQSNAAVMAQVRHGKGKAIITTLPLLSNLKNDPMARFLLASLARYVDSGRCDPKLRVDLAPLDLPLTLTSTGETDGSVWRYTTSDPGEGWQAVGFDDSSWNEGKSGFGAQGTPNARINTPWTSSDIWLRTEVEMAGEVADAVVRLYHDEDAEVYVNGTRILDMKGYVTNYRNHRLDANALQAFRTGRNVIAVHCRQTAGGQFIDLGLKCALKR